MKKLFLLLFVLFFPFEIINLLYKNAEYFFGDNDVSRFKNVPYDIQIANSGNSLGEQMDYSNHPELNAFKFSLLMQPINYDFHILEQYIDHFAKDSIFVIVLSYGEVDGILNGDIFKLIKGRYYQFLKSNYMEEYSIFDKIRYCAIPVVYSEFPFFKIKQRFLSESENMADEKSAGIKKTQGFSFLEKRFEQENFMHAFNTTYPRQKQSGIEYNKNYVLKMVQLCNEHNIHPIVVTPPLPGSSVEILKKSDYFDAFEILKSTVLEECKKREMEINWLDFNRSAEYTSHEEWFKDPVHLKDEYCAEYTDKIISAVRELGFLQTQEEDIAF